MFWALAGGLAGTAVVAKPVYDLTTNTYKYFKPSKSKATTDLFTAPLDPYGNPIIDDDLQRRLEWSGADDVYENLPGGVQEYLHQQKLASEKREAESAQRIRDLNPMNKLNEELVLAQKRDLLEAAQHRRLEQTSRRINEENVAQRAAEALRWDKTKYYENQANQLELRRDTLQGDLDLRRLDLLDRQGRQDWQQQQYERQLTLDEEQRLRDQRKFYALLGQSLLSEGLKAII